MVRPQLAALVLVALVVPASAATDRSRPMGMYTQQGTPLAMLDSDVVVRVRGPIVEATVFQTFRNDTDRVTEATYIFPLPQDAAVSAMELELGTRTVRAAIEAREQAQQRYERAVAAGVGAGLLEQDRPDVFTQTVSAIPARGTVKVMLRFDSVARFHAGTWELVLPLVVAPRYVPGTASGRPTTGTGRAPDTDRAPDASRVTPGGAPGAGGRTEIRLELADPVEDVISPTHEIVARRGGYAITDPRSDHDAIVRWRSKASAQAWVEAGDDGGFAAVLVEAKPAAPRTSAVRVVLLLDHAATTRGDGDAVQRPFVRALLGALDPRDSVALGGRAKLAFGTAASLQRALDERWPSKTGPFDLTKVIATLRGDHPVVLVTDGLVADDRAVLAAAAKLRAPVHVIGIGPAPNRSLLTRLAHATGGTVRFAVVGDDFAVLARDVLADAGTPPERIAVTWGTLAASDVVPAVLPRLGAGQAMLVLAKVKQVRPAANARVRGDVFGFTAVTTPRPPEGATSTRGQLARRWAKLKLDELVAAGNRKAITDHALRFGLVSPTTAMVAIGEEVIVKGGVKHTVAVPVSVPAGMQWQLVKQQTAVDTTVTMKTPQAEALDRVAVGGSRPGRVAGKKKKKATEKAERRAEPKPSPARERVPVAAGPSDKRPVHAEQEDDEADASRTDPLEYGSAPAPAPIATAPEPGGADADDEQEVEEMSLDAELSSVSRRSAVRLSLALGAGFAISDGNAGALGALGARVEVGRRTLVGVEGSLWLVDGVHGQGSVLATVARRGVTRRLELGGGVGLRITGDALGPAVDLALRTLLPVRGLAAYLRYDGALLRRDTATTGQHAGSLGIEARW